MPGVIIPTFISGLLLLFVLYKFGNMLYDANSRYINFERLRAYDSIFDDKTSLYFIIPFCNTIRNFVIIKYVIINFLLVFMIADLCPKSRGSIEDICFQLVYSLAAVVAWPAAAISRAPNHSAGGQEADSRHPGRKEECCPPLYLLCPICS